MLDGRPTERPTIWKMLAWIMEESFDATSWRILERRIGPIIATN